MEENTIIERVKGEIEKLEKKDFNIYFFVIDTKGNPSGELEYIYEMALSLHDMKYNVTMLHNEEEFVGVESWLGEEYANLPHKKIGGNDEVQVSPSDFLFIPEIYSNVMEKTRDLPCKRVVIMQNFNFLTEFIPVGATWADFGIRDAVAISETHKIKANEYFPFSNIKVVRPYITSMFERDEKEIKSSPKQLIVNIVAKDPSTVNKIVKPFFWKYPLYKWVAFRQVRGLNQKDFSEAMKESAITIWVDTDTSFGLSALQAMMADNLVIGKVPEHMSEWMVKKTEDENDSLGLTNSAVWFDNFEDLPKILASAVRSWTMGSVPEEIYREGKEISKKYNVKNHLKDVKIAFIDGFINERKEEFKEFLNEIEKENKNK